MYFSYWGSSATPIRPKSYPNSELMCNVVWICSVFSRALDYSLVSLVLSHLSFKKTVELGHHKHANILLKAVFTYSLVLKPCWHDRYFYLVYRTRGLIMFLNLPLLCSVCEQ